MAWERAYPCRVRDPRGGLSAQRPAWPRPRPPRSPAVRGEVRPAARRAGRALRPDASRVAAGRHARSSTSRSWPRQLGPGHGAAGPGALLLRPDRTRPGSRTGAGGLVDVSAYPVVEDLYLAADVMLTDYSSAMFDYAVLDRPMVIFAPDWPVYQRTARRLLRPDGRAARRGGHRLPPIWWRSSAAAAYAGRRRRRPRGPPSGPGSAISTTAAPPSGSSGGSSSVSRAINALLSCL